MTIKYNDKRGKVKQKDAKKSTKIREIVNFLNGFSDGGVKKDQLLAIV